MKPLKLIIKKAFILPLFIAALTLAGCSDDDGGSTNNPAEQGTLTCKINGEEHNFSYLVSANDPPSEETIHFVTIGGHETNDFTSPGFGFQLVSTEGATATTYTSADSELHGNYYIQNLDSNGNITGTTTYHGNGSDGTSFVLNITGLHDWGVEGTFSGVLQLTGGEEYITVTDGKFSAPYNYRN
ncbi:hypothetical protein AMR72_08325 [Flavobacterium psychrophilum]|nr:hypothetical protein AMR72_08325 [Flavobacterium psychrophilum]AOE52511.1 hypothetical protein ALW18_08315 [Flavobacterium psychrophilum]